MPIATLAPPPVRSRLVDRDGRMSQEFNNWLRGLTSAVNSSATQATPGPTTVGQVDSALGLEAILTAAAGGTYRLSYAVRVAQPATTSSSVQVELSWYARGVKQTLTGAAVTGNTTTSGDQGATLAIVDNGSSIYMETFYSSTGATAMTYDLTVTVEALG